MRIIRFIIPAYKNPEQLRKCKEAIANLNLPDGILTDITVINNTDNNVGFTKAVNIGMREAVVNEDYLAIVLNQDCYLDPESIKQIVVFMDANPKCAIAGIKQLHSEDPDRIIHGGCTEAYPTGRHIGGLVSRGDCAFHKQMPWVNGACMVVRVSAVVDFGLMDESMFLFGSDSDWCYTARARGFEVWYIASASCVHEQGVSNASSDKTIHKWMYLDMLAWRNKWIGSDLFKELSMEIFEG